METTVNDQQPERPDQRQNRLISDGIEHEQQRQFELALGLAQLQQTIQKRLQRSFPDATDEQHRSGSLGVLFAITDDGWNLARAEDS
jgi:Tfp pilus assembly protein PilF